MIKVTAKILLNEAEIQYHYIRSPGPGGQNVNKVETAVQLRFNVLNSSSLPEDVRTRLISFIGKKLTQKGELLIKASRYRSQERNKQDALGRLLEMIRRSAIPPKKRRKTKPAFSVIQRRLSTKKLRGKVKSLRSRQSKNEE